MKAKDNQRYKKREKEQDSLILAGEIFRDLIHHLNVRTDG